MLEQILIKAASFAIGFIIGSAIMLLVSALWNLYKHHVEKKRILKAIKKLDIEEDLANCPCGINASLQRQIEAEIGKHLCALDMVIYISDLREAGKIKPVNSNMMNTDKRYTEHNNDGMLLKSKEHDIRSNLETYIERWGFKEGVEVDMFNLTQCRLDELNNIYALIRDVMVTHDNLYKWSKSEKYYVTISGYVLLVDYDKMREMAIDLECTCGSNYKLIALSETYVNEHLNTKEANHDH